VKAGDHPDRNDDDGPKIGDGGALLAQRDEKRCPERAAITARAMSGTAA